MVQFSPSWDFILCRVSKYYILPIALKNSEQVALCLIGSPPTIDQFFLNVPSFTLGLWSKHTDKHMYLHTCSIPVKSTSILPQRQSAARFQKNLQLEVRLWVAGLYRGSFSFTSKRNRPKRQLVSFHSALGCSFQRLVPFVAAVELEK